MNEGERLGTGDRIAIAIGVGGLAVAIAAVALPIAYADLAPSNWRLIFWISSVLALGSLLFLLYQLVARSRPWAAGWSIPSILRGRATSSIKWDFDRTGYALTLEWQLARRGQPLKFFVPGFIFAGTNGPEHVHQISASVVIDRDGKVIPLFISAEGQWVQFSEANGIPAKARFEIGCQMRSDTLHCEGFSERISPEQFLMDIGGFTFRFGADGEKPKQWHFPLRQLRKQFERQKREAEDQIKNDPAMSGVTRRDRPG